MAVLNILPISLNKLPILKVCAKHISKAKYHKDLSIKLLHWVFHLLSFTPHSSLALDVFYYLFSKIEHFWENKICSKCLRIFVLNAFFGGNKAQEDVISNLVTSVTWVVRFWRFWARCDWVDREINQTDQIVTHMHLTGLTFSISEKQTRCINIIFKN